MAGIVCMSRQTPSESPGVTLLPSYPGFTLTGAFKGTPFFLPLISLPFPHYNGSVIFKVCTWWPSQHNNKPSSPPNKGCQSLIPPVPDCQIIIHASHILT